MFFAKLTSPGRRSYLQSYIISESFAERIWKCVFLICNDIMQASRHKFLKKIANKMTAIQAILIIKDLTPCLLLPVKPFQPCGAFADTTAPLLCVLSLLSSLLLS